MFHKNHDIDFESLQAYCYSIECNFTEGGTFHLKIVILQIHV